MIESGKKMPSDRAVEHFANRLSISAVELATGLPDALPASLELQLQDARVALSSGEPSKAHRLLTSVAREARRFGLDRVEARSHLYTGLILERQGDLEAALTAYEKAEQTLANEPMTFSVDSICARARCLQMQGDVRYATHLLERTLFALEDQGLLEPRALLRLHASLTAAYFEAGMYRQAGESARAALRLSSRSEDAELVATMYVNAARVFLHEGRPGDCEDALARAHDLYSELGLQTEIGRAYLARGYQQSREKKHREARASLDQARSLLATTGSRIDEARCLTELARLERVTGLLPQARILAEEAMRLLQAGDVSELGRATRELGLSLGPEDGPLAEKHLRAAVELFERADETGELRATCLQLGDLLLIQGDEVAAREAYRAGLIPDRGLL